MRVLWVGAAAPWPLRSGAALRTFHLLREASKSCEVHARFVLHYGFDEIAARAALKGSCASLEFLPSSAPPPWTSWTRSRGEVRFHSSGLRDNARNELERGSFDVVHVGDASVLRSLPLESKAPIVIDHVRIELDLARHFARGARARFDGSRLRALEDLGARSVRMHVVSSEADRARLLVRHPSLRATVVPNGVDASHHERVAPFGERDDGRVLYLGTLDLPWNVDAIAWYVRAVHPIVRSAKPNVVLEIVGSRSRPSIHAMASTSVRILGEVDDVRHALSRAAVLVAPMRVAGSTRLSVLDALASGCPVVSTTLGAEGLGVTDSVHLWIADDPESFARAVIETLEDRAAARDRSDHARAFVREHLSWEASATTLVDAWRAARSTS